ncbi:glycosyltransferase [Corynebacterium aquatimens]|nr:glycosyltransferase [Corynebacterium aquatimens]
MKKAAKGSILWVLKRAETVIVTTEGHKAKLDSDFRLTKNPPDIHVVRNVFPTPCPPAAASRPGSADPLLTRDLTSLKVIYAGTVGRAQQLTTAIEAVRIARNELGVEVTLRIIGDGAAWSTCRERADSLGVPVEMQHRVSPAELAENYLLADTVLVQLAPWKSLSTTVPSKTYELMANGQHITLAASGEVADLILQLKAGVVVPPGDATALAAAWADLARNREQLAVCPAGANWVRQEQKIEAPRTIQAIFGTEHSCEPK